MPAPVVLLSVPGLRARDLAAMPNLKALTATGEQAALVPSFPCVTCPVQANMTTGVGPAEHGVVANGFFYRDKLEIEMWTAWNECIQRPQLWEVLAQRRPGTTSAVWFPLHSKGAKATYICTPAPIHNPDGSESLWCYTQPTEMYGTLRDKLGHFPLHHFWGPLANIKSTAWIVDSAIVAAQEFKPDFFYIYLPHLDYAGQKAGPESPQALAAVGELDAVIGKLASEFGTAYGTNPLWLVASEYTISAVSHVSYPNRILREAGLLTVKEENGEVLDLANSAAWALADHQLAHVFVKDADPATIAKVADLFRGQTGVAEVLAGDERAKYGLVHPRAGEVVLISQPDSWFAYYYWLDDAKAPSFARTVDIHRKPGYDPAEMHVDMPARTIPLDATRVKGSHGAPVAAHAVESVLLSSHSGVLGGTAVRDVEVFQLVLKHFGVAGAEPS